MKKQILCVILVVTGIFVAGIYSTSAERSPLPVPTPLNVVPKATLNIPVYPVQNISDCPRIEQNIVGTSAYTAGTIKELFIDSDLVVRGNIEKLLPSCEVMGQLGAGDKIRSVYTESIFRIAEIYKGVASNIILITQVGSNVPTDNKADNISRNGISALFAENTEHVLFLKRVPANDDMAPGKETYILINSAGRYDIQGTMLCSYSSSFKQGYAPPSTLNELVDRISKGDIPVVEPDKALLNQPTALPAPTAAPEGFVRQPIEPYIGPKR